MAYRTTYQTYLMYDQADNSTYVKLIDIIDYSGMAEEQEYIEQATLSHRAPLTFAGNKKTEAKKFTALYDKTAFTKLKALEGKKKKYAIWLGGEGDGETATPNGSDGKFSWTGELSVTKMDGQPNEADKMQISISTESPVEFA